MSDLNYKSIGDKIRKRRKSLMITQEYLADRLNVNPSHISNIECGRTAPSLTILVNIANILHCSVDFFLFEEYTYESERSSLDEMIITKLKFKDNEVKEKLLKIADIL